jgi:hypothetical protein
MIFLVPALLFALPLAALSVVIPSGIYQRPHHNKTRITPC